MEIEVDVSWMGRDWILGEDLGSGADPYIPSSTIPTTLRRCLSWITNRRALGPKRFAKP